MSWQGPRGGRGGGGRGGGGGSRGGGGGYQGGGGGGGFRGGGFRGGGRGGGGGGFRGGRVQHVKAVFQQNPNLNVPDAQVTKIEDAYAKNASGIGAMANMKLTNHFPARPGYGTLGTPFVVYANYFHVLVNPNIDLHLTRYNVEVAPAVAGKKLRRIFQLLLDRPEFSGVVTEWKSLIIAQQPLDIPADYMVEIPYRADGEDEPLEKAVNYKVRVVSPTTLAVSDLLRYLSALEASPKFEQKAEVTQGLNTVLGHFAQSHPRVVTFGENRHYSIDRNPRMEMSGGLEALRGYYKSVRTGTGRLLLNVNVTHAVFLEPGPLDVCYRKIGSGNKVTLAQKLKALRVKVTHIAAKKSKTGEEIPRIKTISALARPGDASGDSHPPRVSVFGAGPKEVEFWIEGRAPSKTEPKGKAPKKPVGQSLPINGYISVFKYFSIQYPKITLNPNNPVVNVGNREHPSYLPAEVCHVIEGQPFKRRLTGEDTATMIEFACRYPKDNAESIVGDGRKVLGLNQESNSTLLRYGFKIGQGLITVQARKMQAPPIKYKDMRNKEHTALAKNGSWNMRDIKFHTGSNIGSWHFLWIRSRKELFSDRAIVRGTVKAFAAHLQNAGIQSGGLLQSYPPLEIDIDSQESNNDKVIKDAIAKMATEAKARFLLVVLPYQDPKLYASVKCAGDLISGVNTVCCIVNKITKEKGQGMYFGNVSMKFNLKAGGINQFLDAPKLGIVSEGKTMVVGLDVTHPSPGSADGAPSVAGIVASVDKYLGQWPGDFSIQEGRVEMVAALERMITSRLRLWMSRNKNQPPENILLYRDGVSEGQYQQVLEQELPHIRNACKQVYPPAATKAGFPKITIVVCGKRHHTRFFPMKMDDADDKSNCPAGTIVDRGITESVVWDFYLQSHGCLQGTARSAHYVVIMDEIFRSTKPKPAHQNHADTLQDLTHNMSHLFGRATKAVSLCPPAYYADLLCERTRCYLAEQFAPSDTSVPPSVSSSHTPIAYSGTLSVHPTLKDTMFYV